MEEKKKPLHILIIEDEVAFVYLLRRVFKPYGRRYKLTTVASIAMAKDVLDNSSPDIVIADLFLPDGRSIELFKDAKYKDRFPVIIMTGYGDEKVAVDVMKSGVLDYIVKSGEKLKEMPQILEKALRQWNYLTEQKQADQERKQIIQELEKKKAEIDSFTHNVAHYLKSPLISVKGLLEYWKEDKAAGDAKRMKEDIKHILSAVSNIEFTLDQLLELYRISQLSRPTDAFSFEELVRDVLMVMNDDLKKKNIHVELDIDRTQVFGHRTYMMEVVNQLLNNAISFIGKTRKPQIKICSERKKNVLTVSIQDNGIGIAPDDQNRVFRIFEKVDSKSKGMGIGLLYCKRVMEAHGQKIWLESKGLGKGSTFFFTLDCDSSS